ncbi:hypothetical protein [Streptomyces sp. SCSIO ZS0520]|uniref:hypothetical protein n=1 Tax=Streptomyces sp. SCSIO ZS0520 TaxID=2892996 RepID=UPI0021DB1066|nr:hypothetical protein [Streptomyces sp. SCSIO ZS0520]
MSKTLTLDGLAQSMRALRRIALDFGDLPAPMVSISAVYPNQLHLSLHDNLGAFEPWRAALGIAHDDIDFHTQSTGDTWVLDASIDFAGATVRLTAFGAVLDTSGGRHA